MPHIKATDLVSGTTYDGVWNLQQQMTTAHGVAYHFIDGEDMPWLYPGANLLQVDPGSGTQSVDFGTYTGDAADPATLLHLKTQIEIATGPVTVTVTYVQPNFVFSFSAPMNLLWDDPLTSVAGIFCKNEAPASGLFLQHTLTALNATLRPRMLECTIAESSTVANASRVSPATFIVPTSDFQVTTGSMIPSAPTTSLSISWSKPSAPGVPVPMINDWSLILIPV